MANQQPDALNSGTGIPAIRLVRDNPKAAALVSKLVFDQRAQVRTDIMNTQGAGINTTGLRSIAREGMQNVNDAETIRQLLADTDLATQILVSVILSPKDMIGVETNYQSKLTHWKIPHEVNSTMTNVVRDYFEETYNIKPRLPTILEDVLARRGSYPIAVLPENAIDHLIHNNGSISTEAFGTTIGNMMRENGNMRSLGILGPVDTDIPNDPATKLRYKNGIGLALEHLMTNNPNREWREGISIKYHKDPEKKTEELSFETHITVTDNLHVLKMPQLSQKLREQRCRQVIGRTSALSTEAITRRMVNPINTPEAHASSTTVAGKVFHRPNSAQVVVKEVATQDKLKRRSIGVPLEIHFPSESVVPVHVPNQPNKQIGFFVMLDVEGNPINRGQGINHYRELGMNLQNNSFASSMIQRAGLAMSDNSDVLSRHNTFLTMGAMYGQMLERDLMQRLKNGLVGKNVAIAGNEEVYALMLARSLANEQTQILYIPKEYMTYIAFEFNANGTGRSLLDNTKIIDSMQAMMLVGSVMGALRNAIGRTNVDLELDPDSPDPWKLIETTMGEIMRINGNGFPLGSIDPLDIKDGLMRSQFQFAFSGHPKLPQMKVDFTERNSNYQPPDPKIMEDLRKRRLMAFSLTPEMVDAATGADFATSVSNNSTLLSKRAMMLQQEFTPQISEHLRKHAINSADLVDRLIDIVKDSLVAIMKEFKDDDKIEMFDGTRVTKDELENNAAAKAQFIREIIEDFIGGFSLTLPEPDTTKLDNLNELYKKHSDLVDEALKAWISPEMMDDSIVGPEVANHINVVAQQLKAYLLREWQIKHGLLPELSKLTARNEDGEIEFDMAEMQAAHNESILEIVSTLLTANKKMKEKTAKALEKAGVADSSSSSWGGSSSDTSSTDDSLGGNGSDLGGDFNFDLNGGTGTDLETETSPEETTAPETAEEETAPETSGDQPPESTEGTPPGDETKPGSSEEKEKPKDDQSEEDNKPAE